MTDQQFREVFDEWAATLHAKIAEVIAEKQRPTPSTPPMRHSLGAFARDGYMAAAKVPAGDCWQGAADAVLVEAIRRGELREAKPVTAIDAGEVAKAIAKSRGLDWSYLPEASKGIYLRDAREVLKKFAK